MDPLTPYTLPEGFADLDVDALSALRSELAAQGREIEDAEFNIDRVESLADAIDEIDDRIDRKTRASARADRFAETQDEDQDEDQDDESLSDQDNDNEDDNEDDNDSMSSRDGDSFADEDDDEDDEEEEGDEDDEDDSKASSKTKKMSSGTPSRRRKRSGSMANMNKRRKKSEVPQQQTASDGTVEMELAADGFGYKAGQTVNMDQLADIISRKRHKMGRSSHPEGAEAVDITIATSSWSSGEMLGSDQEDNEAVYNRVRKAAIERRNLVAAGAEPAVHESLVASGGPCAPLTPRYEIFSTAQVHRNLQTWLDIVDGDRGGLSYTPMPDYAFLEDGVTVGTATGPVLADENTHKGRAVIATCPTQEEVVVVAVSRRILFDNLDYRVYPERVRWMLEHLAVVENKAVEQKLLARIEEESEAAVDAAPLIGAMGSTRGILPFLLSAAHRYRKANSMATDAIIDVLGIDTLLVALKADMMRDYEYGARIFAAPTPDIQTELLRRFRINLGLSYYDSPAVGAPLSSMTAQTEAQPGLPDASRLWMWAPGTVLQIDGGSQEFGMVRDSKLNGSNDLELMSERWIEAARVGAKIARYDVPLSASGVGPAAGAANTLLQSLVV